MPKNDLNWRNFFPKNNNIFEVFSEESLHNLLDKYEEIEQWKRKCQEIKDSCKKFNDKLMVDIIADEQIINSYLTEEANKIKQQIDSIGKDLKSLFVDARKNQIIINDKNENILLFFKSDKKKKALSEYESIKSQISQHISTLTKLFHSLFRYTGAYKCLTGIKDYDISRFPSLENTIEKILNDNKNISDYINQVSCKSEYRFDAFFVCRKIYEHYRYNKYARVPKELSVDKCYIKPTIKLKQSPLRLKLKEEVLPKEPEGYMFLLKIGNLKKYINLLDPDLNISAIKEIVAKKEQKRIQKATTEALAAAHQNTTRILAEKIKKRLQSQMKILKYCPYCEKPFDEDVPHADHIYPVSKGGLSTTKNMVYICSTCNSKKSDKTLREFIRENNLDRDRIERNLEILKKTF